MKRGAPLHRSAFAPKALSQLTHTMTREQKVQARAARMANMAEIHRACPPAARGVIERVAGPAQAMQKPQPKRNPALLQMAEGRQCLLCEPGRCRCTPGTTVAAHSNLSIHGKAKGRKAEDCYSVWAGAEAHAWLDQGPAPKAEKAARFMAAHIRQVQEWRRIATDPCEPERFRRAARWALEQLDATPLLDAVDAAGRAAL